MFVIMTNWRVFFFGNNFDKAYVNVLKYNHSIEWERKIQTKKKLNRN